MNPWKCIPVYLHFDADNVEVGLWCDNCQLPSGLVFPVIQMSEAGVGQVGFYATCADCGDFEEEDEDGGDSDRLVRG